MARNKPRPQPTRAETLHCVQTTCSECGNPMWVNYEHRTVAELHERLEEQGVKISQRTVTNLLERYDELVALSLHESSRLQAVLSEQGRVILAVDGLQPDVGHEVLWVIRDCLSGEVLLARSLLSSAQDDVAVLLKEVKEALPVPVAALINDGQQSLRKAIAKVFPETPHGLCHFHYLREAARPVYEADRHAKKELKKQVRSVRQLERQAAQRQDATGQVIHDYCQAVRSALTDDGRPPLEAKPSLLFRAVFYHFHMSNTRSPPAHPDKGDTIQTTYSGRFARY